MFGHIRANLWLLVLTLLICSVLYPARAVGYRPGDFPEQGAREA